MVEIRIKTLTREVVELCSGLGLTAVPEYRTPDGTRIDIAVFRGEERLVAIELEASFKWMHQRVLYNGLKAKRAGFNELWVVSHFRRPAPGWVEEYLEDENVSVSFVHPDELLEKIRLRALSARL